MKQTAPSFASLLFNNNNSSHKCLNNTGSLCGSDITNKSEKVVSTVTNIEYKIDESLTCAHGKIYVIPGKCEGQYSGRTINYGIRGGGGGGGIFF